jgi:circadian clock protein KaiC
MSTLSGVQDLGDPFERVRTGVAGLDEVLLGGLPEHGMYLLTGDTGTGKTTLGLHFLRDGVAAGDTCLFVSLSQSPEMLERIAKSHGWTLDGIHVHAISANEVFSQKSGRQDVFVTDEVELVDIAERVRSAIDDVRPDRLVFDSLSFIEILATAPGRFEHELASLVEVLGKLKVTSLFIVNRDRAATVEMMSDGAIDLEHLEEHFAGIRYRLKVQKMRGSAFHGGHHDFQIVRGGLIVYPRLTLPNHMVGKDGPAQREVESFSSGSRALDALTGGGLRRGTSCLIRGPSGAGKTSLANRYVHAAAGRGQRCLYFLFEEIRETFLGRSEALGMDLRPYIERDLVRVPEVGGSTVLPGELATQIRDGVAWGAEVVVIDSLSGYRQSLPDDELLLAVMRNMIRYLSERGILTLVALTHSPHPLEAQDVGYEGLDIRESVDVMINLQYVVRDERLAKAISVVKRRDGDHETWMRDLRIGADGFVVGEPMAWFGDWIREGALAVPTSRSGGENEDGDAATRS